MVPLAEGTNGTDPDSVAFGIGHGEAFRIEPDLAIEGISDLQHKLGLFNAAAGDHAFFLRQFLAGMDRILKRIGYDDGQLRWGCRKFLGDRQRGFDTNALILRLFEIETENSIQNRILAVDQPCRSLQCFVGGADKFSRFFYLTFLQHHIDDLQPVSDIMSLTAHPLIRFGHGRDLLLHMRGLYLPQFLLTFNGIQPVLMMEYLENIQIHQRHQEHKDQHDGHIVGTLGYYRRESSHHKNQNIEYHRHKGKGAPSFLYTVLNFKIRLTQFFNDKYSTRGNPKMRIANITMLLSGVMY